MSIGSTLRDLSLWLFTPLEVSLSFRLCRGLEVEWGPGVQPGVHPIRGAPGPPAGAQVLGAPGGGAAGCWEGLPRLFRRQPCGFDPAGCVEWAAGLSSSLPALR